ncbi:hypothetical protein [Lacticaseibacillus saniviri]|uniref:Uncharacterized protein n=1 Tax=Lacticaseibacillus saniviri JCM 17471 = DSM 24301 TaxID=1293598 RepID=A0A0R2MZN9_9LACO|nr:hypothetical protein [Lacticaseibacillus saniviri]KRO16186.1 hypothetical protein IV56_GL001902 [Lacticaseibacillus saniviri JCM 17471 = DSM 24301]
MDNLRIDSKAVLMEKRDEAIEHLMDDPSSESWTWILQLSQRKIAELNAKKPMWVQPHGQDGIDNKSSYGSILAHQEAK